MSEVVVNHLQDTSGDVILPDFGGVLQVVQAVITSNASTNEPEWQEVGEIEVTRVSTKSKMLVIVHGNFCGSAGYNRQEWGLMRNHVLCWGGDPQHQASRNNTMVTNTATGRCAYDGNNYGGTNMHSDSCWFLDDAEGADFMGGNNDQTARVVTYQLAIRDANADYTCYFNRGDGTAANYSTGASTITVLEIA